MNKETSIKIIAQQTYCEKHLHDMFMMSDGICFWCGKQVVEDYTLEECSSDVITSCKSCSRSFIE